MKPETITYILGRRMARLEDSRAWVWILTILAAIQATFALAGGGWGNAITAILAGAVATLHAHSIGWRIWSAGHDADLAWVSDRLQAELTGGSR